ncbi:PREDICTED: proteoglycan 4-like [Cyphomyrmex costatus]|uniref:proteoglycan 4-like n=1 Tax=Cyphomyrmex costatus TaxID=456900 RepID=UPI00085220EB|nr:PREDICTED: proteoglycan 4-like [Cyphomyrmex costatus]
MQGYTSQQFLTQLRSTKQQQLPPLPQLQQLSQPQPQQPSQPRQQQPSQPQQQPSSQPQLPQPSQPRQQQSSRPQQQRPAQQTGAPLIQPGQRAAVSARVADTADGSAETRVVPQSPPGSPTLPTAQQRPESTSVRKVTLQLAAWKLHRLDIPSPARTRPPRYCLHPWDLRVCRYTSPRYLQTPPPARQPEPFSGSEWETTNQPGDENANYWGPEKRTATQPALTYCERIIEKRRTTKWTHTQPPLTYKERSPSNLIENYVLIIICGRPSDNTKECVYFECLNTTAGVDLLTVDIQIVA